MTAAGAKELALQLFEQELSVRCISKPSRCNARKTVTGFLRWASQRSTPNLLELTKADIMSYQSWVCKQVSKHSGQPLAAATINKKLGYICLLYACLYRNGVISRNPTTGLNLRVAAKTANQRRPLSHQEVNTFLESIDTTTDLGLRNRSLYELIYSSGLRVNEAACLRVGDINVERRLMIVRGKFDRDRQVPISSVAMDFLKRYLGSRIYERESFVFPGGSGDQGHLSTSQISRVFRKLLRQFDMDIKEISTHSLRHSTATHMLEGGANIRHVQELLGHKEIQSTVRYTHVMTDNLHKIYRRYHPREHELSEEVDERYLQKLESLRPT